MREAVCHVIRTLGESPLALTHRLVLRLLDTLDECLRHPHDIIQEAGAKALRAKAPALPQESSLKTFWKVSM